MSDETDDDEDLDEDQEIQDLSLVLEDTILYSESDHDEEFVPLPERSEMNDIPGFSVCWDNVQKMSVARHQSRHSGNKMLLWANCFATLDRISFTSSSCSWEETVPASSIDLKTFLPSDEDWKQLRSRMELIVARTLASILDLDIPVQQHLPHKYSTESAKKSEVVNLGVVKENPATCKGVIEIMKYLNRYTPRDVEGTPWPIICHGDQLSVERMIECRIAMSSSALPGDRLEGLIPRPQNFHKRIVLLQVTLDTLFGKGACDKGTLTQIKNVFGHRNVKKKASDCMNHLTNFLDFVTEGHILLLAAQLRKNENFSEQLTCLEDVTQLAKEIIQFIWPNTNEYVAAVEDDRKYTCICDEEDGGAEWIECSSTMSCPTRWFHKDCVDVPDGAEDDDWWCSPECQARGLSAYCCGKQLESTWIRCSSEADCVRGEWFHTVCVGTNDTSGIWHCSEVCRSGKEIDHKQAYAMSVLWRGLMHMAERDAERENDGEAMISFWRLNMLEFWEHGHYKYLTLAFRLLASVSGWMPKRISENLIWNSTANLRGEPGCNVPLDLLNEFLNNEFKTNLKRVKGQYTDSAVQRCSLISGTVGKGLEEKFMSQVMDKYIGRSKSAHAAHTRDLKKFVKLYKGERLFQCLPGRHHSSYEHFVHSIPLRTPSKLKDRLMKYCVKLDTERLLCK
ncbi:uncharacterized protein LOC127835183 [Dreissena polymorpha]|uniref:uncharacterized protein LOC127835183 n=1 Tax=Dreissena polymorpha TaxID=45954 RepID=UPI002264196F|nr:uncharacterized protein LOC127835183 [Dreissena polymorpha]